MNVKVTVLMTVYNGGVYLKSSVESVLAQSFKDFEFVIVDDCSTDGSADLIRQFSDPRIVLHRNPENLGQTKSLNIGLRMARGKYVARMDADDRAYPHWLREQMDVIEARGDCAVVSPQAVVMDARDKIVKELRISLDPQDIVLKSVFASPINHVGCLMHRETVLQAGVYDEQYKIVADYALWSKLIEQKQRILTHGKTLVAVRSHTQSISMLEADKRVSVEMADVIRKNIMTLTKAGLRE